MNTAGLKELACGFLQIIYPNLCWLCREPISTQERGLCARCHQALFVDPRPSCPHCAATVGPFVDLAKGCGDCRDAHFAFSSAVRLGPYEGPLRDLVLMIKNSFAEGLAEIVAAEWATAAAQRLSGQGIQCVVPVPLHWWRRFRRGYNQCDALARALSKELRVPCLYDGLRRLRLTALQAGLRPSVRRENVRDAFLARQRYQWRGKTVLVVDDVMTTGSTVDEAARALKQAGAVRIAVAVLARAES